MADTIHTLRGTRLERPQPTKRETAALESTEIRRTYSPCVGYQT